jgi:hypothetical protein
LSDRRKATPFRKRAANPRTEALWTPPEGTFLLKNPGLLKGMRLEKGEWLGIYLAPLPSATLLYASRSPRTLYRKLKAHPSWPVGACRAASRNDLLGEWPEPDHFRELRQRAYEAIAEARKRSENHYGRYTETEVRTAKDFLRDLSNEARNSGKPRGDKPQVVENQKMLRVFLWLSQGRTLKQIAIEEKGSTHYEREVRSLSVPTKRFSQRAGNAFCSRYGKVSASILQDGAHEKCWNYLSSLFGSIERWSGVKSDCREDGYALCEALRRYKPAKAQQKPFSVRYSLQQLG